MGGESEARYRARLRYRALQNIDVAELIRHDGRLVCSRRFPSLMLRASEVLTLIDKKAAKCERAKRAKLGQKDLLELAGKENIELWQQTIANWMQPLGAKVSLSQLRQALSIALVEVWRLAAAFPYAISVG